MNSNAEWSTPVPDHIPDDILDSYQAAAVKVVRRSRKSRRRREIAADVRSADVWISACIMFSAAIAVLGLGAGAVYAAVVWPWVVLYVLLPAAILFAMSWVAARHMIRRQSRAIGHRDRGAAA